MDVIKAINPAGVAVYVRSDSLYYQYAKAEAHGWSVAAVPSESVDEGEASASPDSPAPRRKRRMRKHVAQDPE